MRVDKPGGLMCCCMLPERLSQQEHGCGDSLWDEHSADTAARMRLRRCTRRSSRTCAR